MHGGSLGSNEMLQPLFAAAAADGRKQVQAVAGAAKKGGEGVESVTGRKT